MNNVQDNVFVNVVASVQYRALADKASDAFYRLTNTREQIQSYVFDGKASTYFKLQNWLFNVHVFIQCSFYSSTHSIVVPANCSLYFFLPSGPPFNANSSPHVQSSGLVFLRWTWMMHLSRRMILLKRWKMNLKRCVSSSVALLELYFFANLFIHYIGNVNVWIWDCADSDCWYWAWWACEESHEWDQCRQVPRISCPYLNMNCMYIFSLPTWHFSNTHCKLIVCFI